MKRRLGPSQRVTSVIGEVNLNHNISQAEIGGVSTVAHNSKCEENSKIHRVKSIHVAFFQSTVAVQISIQCHLTWKLASYRVLPF